MWYAERQILSDMRANPSLRRQGGLRFKDIMMSIAWGRLTENILPCLVGSSRIWCFGDLDGSVSQSASVGMETDPKEGTGECLNIDDAHVPGRELTGEEALSIQGFPLPLQSRAFLASLRPAQLMDLAGNAFSAFVCLAVLQVGLGFGPWPEMMVAQSATMEEDEDSDEEDDETGEEEDQVEASQACTDGHLSDF